MAEGFARKYGSDVMEAQSAGLAPAPIVQALTCKVMLDKNINIEDLFPKDFTTITLSQIDLIINMSGFRLPTRTSVPVRDWVVPDPIGTTEDTYVSVRDQIETLVMQLILELRKEAKRTAPSRPQSVAPSPAKPVSPSHPAVPRPSSQPPQSEPGRPTKQPRFLRSR